MRMNVRSEPCTRSLGFGEILIDRCVEIEARCLSNHRFRFNSRGQAFPTVRVTRLSR